MFQVLENHKDPSSYQETKLTALDYLDDATDWKKVYLWMKDTVEDENYVFYSGGRIADAKAFTEANPDYLYFDDIFDADFQKDFGGANLGNEDVANACSKAMGLYAKGETRVFGDKDGKLTGSLLQMKVCTDLNQRATTAPGSKPKNRHS